MGNLGLDIGLSGLRAAQTALDTIGHNITNANTPGYSRREVRLAATRPHLDQGLYLGAGVETGSISRATDAILNRRIVAQLASVSRLDALQLGMSSVEALLGEPGGAGIGALLDGFFASVADLSVDPGNLVDRTVLARAADELTGRFHELTGELEQQRLDALGRVRFLVEQVNSLAGDVRELNVEIARLEAQNLEAGDLRDQRDEALRTLAAELDVSYFEDESGASRVSVAGQLLVGATTTDRLVVEEDAGGAFVVKLAGSTQPIEIRGGRIGGLLELAHEFLPELQADLDALAHGLIFETNRAHATGVPPSGGFGQLTAAYALSDADGDGDVTNDLLAAAGLPFELGAGELYVNVTDASGGLATHVIELDPTTTTVGGLLDALDAISGLDASLDGFGRLVLTAEGGATFDFGRRLNPAPDAAGTFGGSRASAGTASHGPFALQDGDTLGLAGAAGAFSVTFDATDFEDIGAATAAEVAAALNADTAFQVGQLRAEVVGDQVFVQTTATGAAASFDVTGGTALGALGVSAGTVSGHDAAVNVTVGGTYGGAQNRRLHFRPLSDGAVGTTPGLVVEVTDSSGGVLATLDVGAGYAPGTELALPDGLVVSFGYGELSATNADAFVVEALAEPDTSGVLAALGLNAFFVGTDAQSMRVREDIAADPLRIATSSTGAAGDAGTLLAISDLQNAHVDELDGTFAAFYGNAVGRVGFEIASTENAADVERFLTDSLIARREEVAGVNVDEELVDLVRYEQAFGAAAQYIQVVNAIGDEILSLI